DFIRREQAGVGQGDGHADVQDVGRLGGAVLRLYRVDFLLAGAIGKRGIDLDAVLGGEGRNDGAVIRPRGRQRDDVERAFLLGRRDQRRHAAASRGGSLRRPVGPAARARRGTRRRAASREQRRGGDARE